MSRLRKTAVVSAAVVGCLLFCGVAIGILAGLVHCWRGNQIPKSAALKTAEATKLFTDLRVDDRSIMSRASLGCTERDAAGFALTGFDRCGNPVRITVCCDCGMLGGDTACQYLGHIRVAVRSAPDACVPAPPTPEKAP